MDRESQQALKDKIAQWQDALPVLSTLCDHMGLSSLIGLLSSFALEKGWEAEGRALIQIQMRLIQREQAERNQ